MSSPDCYWCADAVYPSHWTGSTCKQCKQPMQLATWDKTTSTKPAPMPRYSPEREAGAHRAYQDSKARGDLMAAYALVVTRGGDLLPASYRQSVAMPCKAYLAALADPLTEHAEIRLVVWAKGRISAGATETVIEFSVP